MPKMIDRRKMPPGDFQVLHPEAGMKTPYRGSFMECCKWELSWRIANPQLAESLGLPPDIVHVEWWVDEQNALRCIANGHSSFVQLAESVEPTMDPAQKKTLFGVAAAGGSRVKSAISAYLTMFGSDGPVSPSLANEREAVCLPCKYNDRESLVERFGDSVAATIMSLLGALKDLKLQTKHHEALGVCEICDCPMKAKVWTPIKSIAKHLPKDVFRDLQRNKPDCWVLTEKDASDAG